MDSRLRGNDKGKVDAGYKKQFLLALNDDLNMPKAFAVVWEFLKSKKSLADKQATLLDFDKVLGLGLGKHKFESVPAKIKELATRREAARQAQDWKMADKLRDQIEKLGFIIKDTPKGVKLEKL